MYLMWRMGRGQCVVSGLVLGALITTADGNDALKLVAGWKLGLGRCPVRI